jgi:hypothetical protein
MQGGARACTVPVERGGGHTRGQEDMHQPVLHMSTARRRDGRVRRAEVSRAPLRPVLGRLSLTTPTGTVSMLDFLPFLSLLALFSFTLSVVLHLFIN